jgi:hypothetical protein
LRSVTTIDGGVRSKALVVAYGVHETGRREIIGIDVGKTEEDAAEARERLAGVAAALEQTAPRSRACCSRRRRNCSPSWPSRESSGGRPGRTTPGAREP